jgi:hypothetical protein
VGRIVRATGRPVCIRQVQAMNTSLSAPVVRGRVANTQGLAFHLVGTSPAEDSLRPTCRAMQTHPDLKIFVFQADSLNVSIRTNHSFGVWLNAGEMPASRHREHRSVECKQWRKSLVTLRGRKAEDRHAPAPHR